MGLQRAQNGYIEYIVMKGCLTAGGTKYLMGFWGIRTLGKLNNLLLLRLVVVVIVVIGHD